MKKTLFHGTTWENYKSILENGFNSNLASNMTWNVSDSDAMYFYDMDKSDYPDEDIDVKKEELVRNAFESARISASVQKSKSEKLIVIELEVDTLKVDVEDDYSCPNMSEVATVVNSDELSLDMIKNVYVSDDCYNPHLSLFYIRNLTDNQYLNTWHFTDLEMQALEVIQQVEYIEDYFEWELLRG